MCKKTECYDNVVIQRDANIAIILRVSVQIFIRILCITFESAMSRYFWFPLE